jgi:hypothetical protein
MVLIYLIVATDIINGGNTYGSSTISSSSSTTATLPVSSSLSAVSSINNGEFFFIYIIGTYNFFNYAYLFAVVKEMKMLIVYIRLRPEFEEKSLRNLIIN